MVVERRLSAWDVVFGTDLTMLLLGLRACLVTILRQKPMPANE